VNLLLDTHVVLWAFADPDRLSPKVRAAIVDPRNMVAVSAATVWEVEIKRQLGKLVAPDGFGRLCIERGFDELPISFAHAQAAGALPRHHDDPFDRMLIAQAVVDELELVTANEAFRKYDVRLLAPA
jgi:PIN domain nuclease of toxin-antitoxin system